MPLFEGLRVLDLSWHVAGPGCTRLLEMGGARVTKVERPGTGDPTRSRPWLFTYLNAGKRSITLDFKQPKGAELLGKLVEQSDVVVESFSPGAIARAGFGYEDIRNRNPRVVLVSLSNFGQTGPYRDMKSADVVSYALGGHLYIQGEPGREPLRHAGEQAQYQAGAVAATATAAAVFDQVRTGEGQHVDVAVMEVVVSLLESTLELFTHQKQIRMRSGNRYQWTYPVTMLPCKDGWVVVNAGSERSWESFCTMMGREDLLTDERYLTPMQRVEQSDAIDALLEPWLMARTRSEILTDAQTWRLPFGPANRLADVLEDAQLNSRDYFSTLTTPDGVSARFPGPFARLSRTPVQAGAKAPALGEDNRRVYVGELGLSDAELTALIGKGVV